MQIGTTEISRDGRPFIIAEIGVNHDGDVARGKALIDAARTAGADAVKFQLFDAELLLSAEAGLVSYQKASANSAHDLLAALQLSAAQMGELVGHAKSVGLAAIVTPFSVALVKPCVEMGVDGLKLASPDLVNRPLVEEAMKTKLPTILSTGQATLDEVKATLGWVGSAAARMAFLHCVSSYPTRPEDATLAAITVLRNRWPQMCVGYSDHTLGVMTGALAVAAGACVLEKHFTHDRAAKGPDHAASLEAPAFAEYARLAREAYLLRGAYEKKPRGVEVETRLQTRQSLCAVRDLAAGTVLAAEMLATKRPGTGIPAGEITAVVGKTLVRAVPAGALLNAGDLGQKQGK